MKTRLLFNAAALLGAIAVGWMALDFIGSNVLALLVTVVIGFAYALGLAELVQFRRATATLGTALETADQQSADRLEEWLGQLHPSLRNAVAQRIQGERVGLPAPVFSPYLVGLLVMLGLLGTFIGMVDTLQGAVTALEGSTELSAIRAGLAAPIAGLGLAFGTSVAGVAASAMLGLNATLSRRERIQVTRDLDSCASTLFRQHSLQYNRQRTYLAMQDQAEALPLVAERLTHMAGELERAGNRLAEQLLANQEKFHLEAREQYTALAQSVDASLRESLSQSGKLAGESITPAVEQLMAQLASESRVTNEQLLAANQSHLAEVSQALGDSTTALREGFGSLRDDETDRSERLASQLTSLQEHSTENLQSLAAISASLKEATESQQASATDFLSTSIGMLQSASEEFREQLSGEATRLTDITANVAGSAVELASLGEAFSLAVQLFSESNQSLVDNLSRIEDSMEKSTERSDEQMSYYVAQAREIIDQSMLSQREIIEELRRLGQTGDLFAAEAS